MRIAQNIVQLKTSLPQGVTLVAVSKFHPVEALWELTTPDSGCLAKAGHRN